MSGVVGWSGRAIVGGLFGVFLIRAAWQADPSEAKGLDAALREVADTAWGAVLVLVTGIGLVVYGVHCMVTARRQRLTAASS